MPEAKHPAENCQHIKLKFYQLSLM